VEILLDNGTIVDGTGAPPRPGSVLVRDGKVAQIGPMGAEWPAAQRIDCSGLIIAPGFVDVHAHSDYEVVEGLSNKILQGVTTEVVGNCGYSLFPMKPDSKLEQLGSIYEYLPPMTMVTAADYFSVVETAKPLVNVAALTGHSPLRNFVIGMDRRAPSGSELKGMERLLEQSLDEGSIGFSTGLNLMPCSFADFGELVSLCRVLKRYRAYYTTHMRDYKFHVVDAVREAIRLAEESDAPVQLSHVQVVGKKCWHHLDTILELVDAAARRGLDIEMDAYPYLAGSCSFVQFLPEWSQDGGLRALLDRLESPALYGRIARETEDFMSNTWADIVISGVKRQSSRSLLGKSIEEAAVERGAAPRETAMDLLREQEGHLDVISFNSRDENLRKVLCHPLTSMCTDGFVAKGLSHPRTFGSYPEFLGKYVRDCGWMPLETAIVKTSAGPARRFQLLGRGMIAAGNWADLVVFDAAAIGTKSDYSSPAEPPEGIRAVLVNGEIVVEKGELTGARPGAVLRHASSGAAG
jgi:dihydroorotase/N-acyl-D-amino-acid deacylase